MAIKWRGSRSSRLDQDWMHLSADRVSITPVAACQSDHVGSIVRPKNEGLWRLVGYNSHSGPMLRGAVRELESFCIVRTRVQVGNPSGIRLRRGRLLQRIMADENVRLVVVEAPPGGYGKSSLICDAGHCKIWPCSLPGIACMKMSAIPSLSCPTS